MEKENNNRKNIKKESKISSNEVLFENNTVWGGKDIQRRSLEFLWYVYNKKILIIINVIWMFLFIGNMHDLIVLSEVETSVKVQSMLMLCLITILLLIITFIPSIRKYKSTKRVKFNFKFYKNYMIDTNDLMTTKVSYVDLEKAVKKICEDDYYVYFILSRTQIKIIDKKGFVQGDEKDFSEFLKKKFGKLYKRYSKKVESNKVESNKDKSNNNKSKNVKKVQDSKKEIRKYKEEE